MRQSYIWREMSMVCAFFGASSKRHVIEMAYFGQKTVIFRLQSYSRWQIGSRTYHPMYSKYEQHFTSGVTRENHAKGLIVGLFTSKNNSSSKSGWGKLGSKTSSVYYSQLLGLIIDEKNLAFQPYHWDRLIHKSYRFQIWRYQREFVGSLAGPLAYCV